MKKMTICGHSSLKMFISFYTLFAYCLIFTVTKATISCNQPPFKNLPDCKQSWVLVGSMFLRFNTSLKFNCSRTCVQYENCTSFNIGQVHDGMLICELNSHVFLPSCFDLIFRENSSFYLRVSLKLYV